MNGSRPEQFGALVAPHLEALFRVAYRLVRNTPDAQDLVQDTCVVACASLAVLAVTESPLRWLLRVQQNRFIDSQRRRNRSPVTAAADADAADLLLSEGPDPEELMQQAQDEQLLEEAFLQLDEMQRTLLSLRAEGYDLAEIESITGIEHKVLSARLHRARMSLAQRLVEQQSVVANRRVGSQP
jgi:RNA polymerase sigma-70 factor (ECF subfamily)